jgi:hypothetical protein
LLPNEKIVTSAPPAESAPVRLDIVLPAGGRISGDFARVAGVEVKALIMLGGETLLKRTIDALRVCDRIGSVIVVGPPEALAEADRCGADAVVPEGSSGPDNIFRGLDVARGDRALIGATDMPFLSAQVINGFLDMCPPDADLAVPIIRREAFEAEFPGFPRQDTRLRDGFYRIGGLFMVNLPTLRRIRPRFEAAFAARTSDWQMAKLVGPAIALRFLSHRLGVEHVIARANRILNCRGLAVRGAPPSLALDIDQQDEYEHARGLCASTFPEPTNAATHH